MTQRSVHKPITKVLHACVLLALLFVQSTGAVLASQHAASGNSKYLCGNGYIPAEAIANIKALLAAQGEPDGEENTACEICGSVAAGTFQYAFKTALGCFSVQSNKIVAKTPSAVAKSRMGAPLGLRAPPFSTY